MIRKTLQPEAGLVGRSYDAYFPSSVSVYMVSNPFLCIISASRDCNYVKFVRYDLKVSHYRHVSNCWHGNNI